MQSGASSIDEEKRLLRGRIRARLRELTEDEKSAASDIICQHLLDSPRLRAARCIGTFAALASEPDLSRLHLEILGLGKRLVFPRIVAASLEFRCPDGEEAWLPGPHGLREPDPAHSVLVPPGEIDLVLTPGLAFDPQGARLGRGGGYYDRWLAGFRAGGGDGSVGVCFASQIEPHLPVAKHDECVQFIVTEEGWSLG